MITLFAVPRSRIIGALRKEFAMSAIAKEARERAVAKEKGPHGGKRYVCADCGFPFTHKEVHVDHIETVVPLDIAQDEMTWDEYIDRLFCNGDITKLQVLCRGCHEKKTNQEKKERALARKFKGAMETLPDHVSEEEAMALIEAIPEHIQKKLSGNDIGTLAKTIVKWFKKLK